MSYELILAFLRPIESPLLDETTSEIGGDSHVSWWAERNGITQRVTSMSLDAGRLRSGRSELNRKGWATTATYVCCDNAKNYELTVNRLGMTIVHFRAGQASE